MKTRSRKRLRRCPASRISTARCRSGCGEAVPRPGGVKVSPAHRFDRSLEMMSVRSPTHRVRQAPPRFPQIADPSLAIDVIGFLSMSLRRWRSAENAVGENQTDLPTSFRNSDGVMPYLRRNVRLK